MKKSLPSRKKAALHRIVLALAAFLLASHFFSLTLLPIQAVHSVEESEGTGRTTFVTALPWEYREENYRVQLRKNKDALLLLALRPSLLGGWGGFARSLDCSLEEKAFFAGALFYSNGSQEKTGLFYGRVTDDAICRLSIDLSLEYRTGGEKTAQHIRTLEIGPEDLLEQDGERYFLLPCTPFSYDTHLPRIYAVVTAYNAVSAIIAPSIMSITFIFRNMVFPPLTSF